jgi:uncharacterized protein (DUF362 family)
MAGRSRWVILMIVLGLVLAGTAAWFLLQSNTPSVLPPAGKPAITGGEVAIVKGQDPAAMVAEALSLIGGMESIVKKGDLVVIKPDLGPADTAARPGSMTDARVIEAIIQEIQKAADCRIVIAEGPAGRSAYASLAQKYGVELADLSADPRVEVKSLYAKPDINTYDMPETIMKCDVLIDVPVLKTDDVTGVSLGMKVLIGLLPATDDKLREKTSEVMSDIVYILRDRKPNPPVRLVVVDGLTGIEGQAPLAGTPVKMNVILAGKDVVAVDSVAAAVMGYDPQKIAHLAKAGKAGLGETNLSKIDVRGATVAAVKHLFAYATRDALVTVPWSVEREKKVLELADGTEDFRGNPSAVFKADRLKPDLSKFPARQSRGFKVRLKDPRDPGQIFFVAPYEAAIPENREAAVAELGQWIETNLGAQDWSEVEP